MRISDLLVLIYMAAGLATVEVSAAEHSSIGEMHPPVIAQLGRSRAVVLFLKNNFKDEGKGSFVGAEVFYIALTANKPVLKYVWKVRAEQIISVFFYDWKSESRLGRSMYVLTKSRLSNSAFEGASYSTMEFSLVEEQGEFKIMFFPKDLQEPALQNCLEGADLLDGKKKVCQYKDSEAVKRYFRSLR